MSGQALDLRRSARIVWRLRVLAGTIIALGVLAGAIYTVLSPAIYQATAYVSIAPSMTVSSQAALVTSPQVLAPALTGVDRGVSLQTERNRIATKYAAAGLMSITAEGRTASQSIKTANVVTRSYVSYVTSNNSLTPEPLPVQLFRLASDAEGTSLPWRLFYAAGTGALAGLILGIIVTLAIGRADPRLRERDEIADSIGVPVLASVSVSHPAKPAAWTKLLDTYEPATADAWRLRKVLRELSHPRVDHADDRATAGSSVAVLSLSGDRKALALGPQLAAFAAAQGVPVALALDAGQDAKVTAALRAACAQAGQNRGPRRLPVTVIDQDDALPTGVLSIVVAVVDDKAPRVAKTIRAETTVLGVASGAVTAQQLARVTASAAGDGRDIAGILVADPDRDDPTTGRLPQLARLGQHRMPKRMTTAVTEIRQ